MQERLVQKNIIMKENVIKVKSFEFAVRVVACANHLQEKNEYVISKQLLRSGTAIGALVREAEMAESKRDFIHKMHIALKEANETVYWIDLLIATKYLDEVSLNSLKQDATELLKILISIVKTSKAG